jgi:DNA-binding CsgD family transcriptional regulator
MQCRTLGRASRESIYRKLGASGTCQPVAQARQLGLPER